MTQNADSGAMPLNHKYIRERRLQLKLTQQECADAAKFPNAAKWSNYENGRIPDPQLSTLETIARVLKCKVTKLIR